MATLRELTTRYNLKFDDKSFKKADGAMNTLISSAKALGAVIGTAVVGRGFAKMIGLASDAEETLNVLNESFKENASAVQEWAGVYAREVGRSEFELREMAGSIGAVLNPLMERNAAVAADMSTSLAGLAVDLGSFFNTTDADAMQALLSGITGQSEPLRRFGVVLLESTLQQFALSKGITKSTKKMTIAEKTALRYQFILDQTQAAQGDAARTAEGFANASKGVTTAIRDLGTRIGLIMLPAVKRLTNGVVVIVRRFAELVKNSNLVQAFFLLLGAAAVALGIKMAIAFAPALLVFAKWFLIIGAIILVVDELITLFKGGETVIGDFIDAIFGAGSAAKMVAFLKQTFFDLRDAIAEAWEGFKLFISDISNSAQDFFEGFTTGWSEAIQVFQGFVDKATAVWDAFTTAMWMMIPEPIKKLLGFVGGGIKAAVSTVVEKFQESDAGPTLTESARAQFFTNRRKTAGRADIEREIAEAETAAGRRATRRRVADEKRRNMALRKIEEKNRQELRKRGLRHVPGKGLVKDRQVRVPVARGTGGGGTSVNQSNSFNMTVNTNGRQDIAAMNRAGNRMAKQAASQQKRATLEAVKQRKAS
jgi:hypothetical protein